ncbi:uncharacterized protein L969DRAFT_88977 [Mixia osmundae IAM 14324]|uniref:LYR motif-containing protein 2 n=1 Tax=Mixia osmundae (strain CBS 9802 / IAM 14324 / JCM 22182 / KY 12970) TaxID=764103 RepID=G7E7X4_MIXOS|nr:uncharacterized protein L969DRAFT_88977 [Mixia osmundae IAM 14324]KEI38535.1 hypothetical protein L969DRAFT_88977 [Mixia osmundae IAM 14324]GAA98934.1 hypothetical protein E5Q_05622 [Mixia osmundae IAM 14324]
MHIALILRARQVRPTAPFRSLDYFLNRGKVLSLYRAYIRSTRGLGDRQARIEAVQWVRHDFDRHRDESDMEKAKALLALGKRNLRTLSNASSLIGQLPNDHKFRGPL